MTKIFVNLCLIFLLAVLCGCGRHSGSLDQLERARVVMEERPDSALAILARIDTASLSSPRERALYGLYLTNARYLAYDPARMSWTSVDPLASKYPQLSPYAYCLNNPIRYTDPQGLKPTEEEAALMAAYVYGDILIKLKGGWQEVKNSPFSVKRSNGLQSMLFQREDENGNTEYALTFAGTQITDKQDWLNDMTQIYGLSSQYADAMDIASSFKLKFKNEVTYVGHSLGGGLSAACAYATEGAGYDIQRSWSKFVYTNAKSKRSNRCVCHNWRST